MEYFFIDELGSLTKEHSSTIPDFIICLVRVKDLTNLRKIMRRFIIDNYEAILKADSRNKIFKNGTFQEIKGSSLSPTLRRKFVRFLGNGHLFELYYIHVYNSKIGEKENKNISQTFNYLIETILKNNLQAGTLPYDDYLIDVDDRNLKKIQINSLEDHLNIELRIKESLVKSINVSYYDSKDNFLIQLSDFFSNFYYSYLKDNKKYDGVFTELIEKRYVKDIMYYPKEI